MKRFEFSKIAVLFTGVVTVIVTAFVLYMVWETKDTSPLAYLVPSIFGECGVATGFYYNKAKAENVVKLGKLLDKEQVGTKSLKVANSILNNNDIVNEEDIQG